MIIHVDMDAFYAAVEQRDNPQLRGKPVVVGGSAASRGVVCAANYEARRYGVHSAMPAVTARRLCPHAEFLPVRMEHYAKVARQIRQIFHAYTPLVEPLSLDEAFLDVEPCRALFGEATEIGKQIRDRIQHELQLVASIGIAPIKFVAKIASDLDKPNGFIVVGPDDVQSFLDPLPIERLWGVGRKAAELLHRRGIRTVRDLRERSEGLEDQYGKVGAHLCRLAHGIDSRHVVPDRRAKQISHETTFAEDISDADILEAILMQLAEQVARRLRRNGCRGDTVHVKVRFHDFQTLTRSQKLPQSTDLTQEVWQQAVELLRHRLPRSRKPIRLLGVGVSGLGPPRKEQLSLFATGDHQRQQQLDATTDAIRDRFGNSGIRRAKAIRHGNQDRSG